MGRIIILNYCCPDKCLNPLLRLCGLTPTLQRRGSQNPLLERVSTDFNFFNRTTVILNFEFYILNAAARDLEYNI
jgi:hypothetical protein